ncbi:MAG: hypothetical protein L3J49_05465 [Desulfobulbaceae bacterium]|nr:hypothetical protein [Desulfobulbaceae bacterium]
MNRKFDTVTLSSYLDGELDVRLTGQVADFVSVNEDGREFILDAIRTRALVRASTRNGSNTDTKSLERIMASSGLARKGSGSVRRKPMQILTRIAAGIMVALLGFGAGSMVDRGNPVVAETVIPQLPSTYRQVVVNTLENEVSGVTRQWTDQKDHLTVKVTPIRTYRDPQDHYYRKYKLVVISDSGRSQIIGLAWRDGKKSWETKSLTFVDGPDKI